MGELTTKQHEGTFEGDENILYLDFGNVMKNFLILFFLWKVVQICFLFVGKILSFIFILQKQNTIFRQYVIGIVLYSPLLILPTLML